MLPGFFISLEGTDGVGKSTQSRLLAERLRAEGREPLETREPGGSAGAEEIRRLLVEGEPHRWSAETEILLFTAARRDHVERLIGPALEAGKVVISDRFADSTRAYQGIGDPALRRLVDRLHEMLIGREPDLTLLLDMEPGPALGRVGARGAGEAENRFEKKGFGFQERLRAAFHAIAAAEPGRIATVDAGGPEAAVAERIWQIVGPRLPAR